jgi:outer membrane biosynthesis protein TonB
MRGLTVLFLAAACGGGPALGNAPRPDPVAVAGVAAAAAAAVTLADPNAASRRPEKKVDENKREVEVKENVNEGVLDRLDEKEQGSAAAPAPDATTATPDPKAKKPAKKPDPKAKVAPKKGAPKIPSPEDLAKQRTESTP